ncbi:hypothetical protein ACLB1O_02435 [Escherichia coli]
MNKIEVENYRQSYFTDYELGKPRQVIVEAKREARLGEYQQVYQIRT